MLAHTCHDLNTGLVCYSDLDWFFFCSKVLTIVEESGMPRLSRPDLDSLNIGPNLDSIEPDLDSIEPDLELISAESDSVTAKRIVQQIRITHFILAPPENEKFKGMLHTPLATLEGA